MRHAWLQGLKPAHLPQPERLFQHRSCSKASVCLTRALRVWRPGEKSQSQAKCGKQVRAGPSAAVQIARRTEQPVPQCPRPRSAHVACSSAPLPCPALPCSEINWHRVGPRLVLGSGSTPASGVIARAAERARLARCPELTLVRGLFAACFLLVSLVPAAAHGTMLSADGECPHAGVGRTVARPDPIARGAHGWSAQLHLPPSPHRSADRLPRL